MLKQLSTLGVLHDQIDLDFRFDNLIMDKSMHLKKLNYIGMPYFSQYMDLPLNAYQITLIFDLFLLQDLNGHLIGFIYNLLSRL